jgi:phosphopantothenoylcysteine synthetase/decarboxylase
VSQTQVSEQNFWKTSQHTNTLEGHVTQKNSEKLKSIGTEWVRKSGQSFEQKEGANATMLFDAMASSKRRCPCLQARDLSHKPVSVMHKQISNDREKEDKCRKPKMRQSLPPFPPKTTIVVASSERISAVPEQ